MCYSVQHPSPSSLSVVLVGTLPKVFDDWRSITSSRFVLNKVKGHHLQLRYHHPSSHNFKWLNIKPAMGNHPIIQKEVDELLAKGAIEPLMGVTVLYLNYLQFLSAVVVDEYSIICNLTALCTCFLLRCPLSHRYGILFNEMFYTFSVDISIVTYHHQFSVEGFAIWAVHVP